MSVSVVCSRLVFREVASPNTRTRSVLRKKAVIEVRGSSTFFQVPEPISVYVDVGMKIEIFPSPRAQEEARAWNFSES